MVEVREIAKGERVPEDSDHMVVERTAGGRYVVNGSAAGSHAVTFFTPAPFESEVAALGAARRWSEENGVPVIYVRQADT
ncbi:hypothetical protein [Antarcticirhabdus aurantiaca]|uniref:Uncharacterized protein n=1 Tax=Antarcticirhabdus aurantiaca TaxID=2606717 RepID=A0ACD4NVY8_9HYPH|nr:hypothetical protein [Antarcticirhabdus aurantiaca]WAJ31165.1 hypothetical protein OXU80_13580 [Jeongeuplla avenae]